MVVVAAVWAPAAGVIGAAGEEQLLVDPDDEVVYELITRTFQIAPYGAEGDELRHTLFEGAVGECMEAAGFEFDRAPYAPDEPIVYSAPGVFPPTPSPDDVERRGYLAFGPPENDWELDEGLVSAWHAADEANAERAQNDPAWALALHGEGDEGEGGCYDVARRYLRSVSDFAATDMYAAMVIEFQPLMDPSVYPSREVAVANAEWSECMADAGYEYFNPSEALGVWWRNPGEPIAAGEIEAALQDLQCRIDARVREIAREQIERGLGDWFAENEGRIAELQAVTVVEIEEMKAASGN